MARSSTTTKMRTGPRLSPLTTRSGPGPARRGPAPVLDLGHVVAVAGDVLLVLNQLIAHRLLGISGDIAELWHPVDHVRRQMKPIEVVADDHVEGGRRRPFLLVAEQRDVLAGVA